MSNELQATPLCNETSHWPSVWLANCCTLLLEAVVLQMKLGHVSKLVIWFHKQWQQVVRWHNLICFRNILA